MQYCIIIGNLYIEFSIFNIELNKCIATFTNFLLNFLRIISVILQPDKLTCLDICLFSLISSFFTKAGCDLWLCHILLVVKILLNFLKIVSTILQSDKHYCHWYLPIFPHFLILQKQRINLHAFAGITQIE